MIAEALERAGLRREAVDVFAVGLGPGSYMGIRGAIAVAQGWQLARNVRLLGVSSADAIAAGLAEEGITGPVSVVVDAQRGEFYLAGYQLAANVAALTRPLQITSRDEVERRAAAGELLAGPEVTRWFLEGRVAVPRAAVLARLAWGRADFASGESLQPIYLRETAFVKAPPPRTIPPLAPGG